MMSSENRAQPMSSPDLRSAAIADATPCIQVWDIATGKIALLMDHSREAAAHAFSIGRHTLISSGLPGALDIWDVAGRRCVASIPAHSSQVNCVAISPDGMIAASGSTDNTIKLWSLKKGSWLATLKGHKRPVWALAFSLDGKTLASGSGDHSVRLWNVSLRREVAILRGFTNRHPMSPMRLGLNFSPDGSDLAVVTQRGDLLLYRAATLDEVARRPKDGQALPNADQ